jgi:molybdopterin biosynthesis enzyme
MYRLQVMVVARPRVGVLSTGDELVDSTDTPGPGHIRDSNRPMLLAAIQEAGAEPVDLGICVDKEVGQVTRGS